MSRGKAFLFQLSFRLGLALVVLGAAIYFGLGSMRFAPASVSDKSLGAIVAGIGLGLLATQFFRHKITEGKK